MSARVTAAERAALPVARAALESQASAYGMADTIVFALGGAQLLQSPETAANAEHVAKCLVERTEELMAAGVRVAALEQQLAARDETAALSPAGTEYLAAVRTRHSSIEGGGWHLAPEPHAEPGTVRTMVSGYQRIIGVFDFRGAPATADANRQFVLYAPSDIGFLLGQMDRATARVAKLEQQLANAEAERADRHDDLAGALGYANEDWADLISIAAANAATMAKGDARVRKLEQTARSAAVLLRSVARRVDMRQQANPNMLRQAATDLDRIAGYATDADDIVIYRASHDSIVIGHYTTAAVAREHCETYARREHHGTAELRLWWREDEDTVDQPEEGPAELIEHIGAGPVTPTGYLVIPVTAAAAYDADGDE